MNCETHLSLASTFTMNHARRLRLSCLAAAIAAGAPALVGCSGGSGAGGGRETASAPAPDDPAGKGPAPDLVNGTIIYSVNLGAGHTIDFFKMAHGNGAARETMPIGDNNAVIDRLSGQHVRLADIFRLAQPESTEVPEAILQADPPAPPAQATTSVRQISPIVKETPDDVSANGTVGALPVEALSAAATCSPDELGDSWGANWFLNNYCTGGNNGWCLTNRTGGYIEVDDTDWFKWSVMAADFAVGATIEVQEQDITTNDQWWTQIYQAVPARTIETWWVDLPEFACNPGGTSGVCEFGPSGNFKAWAIGNSACKRVHYAARWDD